MNFKHILMFASAAVFASACTEEIAPVQEPDVTPVVLAENEMAARLPKMFDFGWSKGDKLTVISSSASQEFTILDDYAVSLAKFKGEALSGDSFTILKSDASTLAAAEAKNYAAQEQAADGNVEHLDFDLALVGVSSYKDVTFSQEWAEENGGEFKMNGVLKINAQFPGQLHVLDGLGIKLDKALFFATNKADSATDSLYLDTKSADVSVMDYQYTGYMLTSWQTANITEADQIKVWAHYGDKSYFAVLPSQNLTLQAGEVAEISIASTDWELYDMNPGSKLNPYQIKTKADLMAMPTQLEAGYTRYFELMADIDLDGEAWVPVNTVATLFKEMVFEGNNHKISNLTLVSDTEYASFAGVLMGSIKNVTFENPSVTANVAKANAAGVVAAMAAYPSGDAKVVIENVTVTGAALNVTGSYATVTGILAGSVKNAEIKNCHTTGTVTHAGANAECNIGGFIGKVDGASMIDCSHEGNVDVTATSRVLGGFVGSIRAASTVTDCSYRGNLTAAGKATYSGLMFGYVAGLTTFTGCEAEGTFTGLNGNSGGFAGNVRNVNGCVFDGCSIDITLKTTANNQNGAFIGHIEGTTEVKNCTAKVNFDAGKGSNYGGLIGATSAYTKVTDCHVTGSINIVASADYAGGIVGKAHAGGALIERCSFDGFIGKAEHNRSGHGGIVGWINCSDVIIRNCWTGGEILGANHGVGGICGTTMPNSTFECCYSTMKITAGHGIGSIVGRANNNANDKQTSENTSYNNIVRKCIAWSPKLATWKTGIKVTGNHSGGAVVGSTVRNNILEDCYRRADLTIDIYKTDMDAPYDQENANLENTLVWLWTGDYHCPYNGKAAAADATVSSVAKTLGWDETIWDLSGDLPQLK